MSGYQTKLTFDTTPTDGSGNPVTSDGIAKALGTASDMTNEDINELRSLIDNISLRLDEIESNLSTLNTALEAKSDSGE